MMREECKGCIFAGKALKCATMDCNWAWYNFLKEIPILRDTAQEPEPCWMRELESEEEQ